MLLGLLLAGGGVLLLSKLSGKPPGAMVVLLVLLGIGWFVFNKVQSGVMGGLGKQVGM
jgi:hypothetical protein